MDVFARNNVVVHGDNGPTFVFSHGFGCDQTMWRHVARAFISKGRVVLFDHVGAGRSDLSAYRSDKYASLQGYADDVVEICEALACDDLIFVGHSVSATIGVLAAVQRPDLFSKLALICASPRYANTDTYHGGFGEADIDELLDLMDKNTLDWSALMSPVLFAQREAELQEEWRDSVCSIDPAIAKEFARATFKSDHRAEYRQVTTSTLIVECAEDSLAPPEVGAYVNRAIVGSRRVVLDAVGHCPHMSAPDEVIAAITAFSLEDAARNAA